MLLREPPLNFSVKAEVVAILTFIEDKILLLQRLPNHPQANLWCSPGGKIHLGETIKDAAVRELSEETGIVIAKDRLSDLGKYYVRYPNGDFIFYLYETYLTGDEIDEILIKEDEHQSFYLCSIEDAYNLHLTPGLDECFEIALTHRVRKQD